MSREIDPITLKQDTVTRCRISGGTTVDYGSDTGVPGPLSPQTGTDLTGACWYYTTASTRYVIFILYANGDAELGLMLDPSNPGSAIAIGPILPRCTSEPAPTSDPVADAWDYVTEYIHPPPEPALSPPAGSGVTGLVTYLGLPVPEAHTATLTSGVTTLDVHIEVSAVEVEWGDGSVDSFPPTDQFLTGYPDGLATHVYESKSEDVPLSVSYDWTARWRLAGGSWEPLPVPNTTTTVGYPLAEIVSDLTD